MHFKFKFKILETGTISSTSNKVLQKSQFTDEQRLVIEKLSLKERQDLVEDFEKKRSEFISFLSYLYNLFNVSESRASQATSKSFKDGQLFSIKLKTESYVQLDSSKLNGLGTCRSTKYATKFTKAFAEKVQALIEKHTELIPVNSKILS